MAKIINDLKLKIISSKRDSTLEKMKFNQSYLSVAKNELNEKADLKIHKKSLKMRKRLLPFEKNAATEREKLQYLFDENLAKLEGKQRLPRLAVEQTYKRKLDKKDKKTADEYKEKAIAKLDGKKNELTSKWTKRVSDAAAEKDKEALQRYVKETKKSIDDLEEYKKESRQEAKLKLSKLEQKEKKSDEVLIKRIAAYNKKLEVLNKGEKSCMKDSDTVLEINDLVMQFEGLKAVDELSFEVKEGEIFGLIGPNGAGKTTVFNCITQFNKPTAGSIYYRNANDEIVNVGKKKVHDIVKLGIVRTFQNLELIWELSVLENMLIGAHSLYGANFVDHLLHTRKLRREEKIMRARALEVLKRLNLLEYKDVIPYGLPYGILKRIELARTLMVNPRLIILDEPAAGLNEAETEELAKTIHKIRKDYNCTIFLVEHDMGLVMDICDTVCAISFGKKLAMGTPSEIQENALVQEAYLGGTMTEDEDE